VARPSDLELLPIDEVLPRIVEALRRSPNLVLRAPTGAGKTTRVAPALADFGVARGSVLLLEPRRVAARAAARRIAIERGAALGGDEVGYQVRFDNRTTARTRIVVMTYGIFLRRIQEDPFLDGVGAVMFDEIHERSLDADLALAMARKAQREARADLHLLAMSATLDLAPLAGFLGNAATIDSAGRSFPIDIRHEPAPAQRELHQAVAASVRAVLGETSGDVLVFLPGLAEIRRAASALAPLAERESLAVMELYGDLPAEEQDAVLRRSGWRKVVLATNVAESSVTIENITAVVDSGLARVLRFDAGVGLDRLEVTRISKASADQRAGRAGRTAPGLCVRLWSAHEDRALRPAEEPEIARVDLSRAVLELRAWGERDVRSFPWLEPPPPAALDSAEALLRDLDALDEQGLTAIGRTMAALPLPPRIARLLIEAQRLGCLHRASIAAAILSERDPLRRAREALPLPATTAWESDLLERVLLLEGFAAAPASAAWPELNLGAARSVLRVARDLHRAMHAPAAAAVRDDGVPAAVARVDGGRSSRGAGGDSDATRRTMPSEEAFLRALLAAYRDRVARRRERGSDRAVMAGGRGVRLAGDSLVHTAELFVCIDIDAGRRGERSEALVRQASAIEAEWLPQTAASVVVEFDEQAQRVVGRQRRMYRDLVLEEKTVLAPREPAAAVLAERAAAAPRRALALDDGNVEQYLARVRSLAQWMPELDLPACDEAMLSEVARELAAGCRSFEEMRKAPLLEALQARLTYEQRRLLDRHAPERIEIPSGSSIRLLYEAGRPPVLAARIQEMFGMRETPRIAAGRVPVLVHLLAPNGRPQQVTDDLASFWRNTYAEVRKQLRARYSKHAWPEDPLTAQPQRRPRRPPE